VEANLTWPVRFAAVFVSAIALAGCQRQDSPIPTAMITPFEVATVLRVIDGDTVELENGERVRYLGIDAPETIHPEKPVQCYGPEASERNKELVQGKAVGLLRDGTDRDAYGRLLRYVFVDGAFVNGDLVWGGYAYARSYGDDPSLYQTLVQLERAAREERRGLWLACQPSPTVTSTPTPTLQPAATPTTIRLPTPTINSRSCCKICVKGKACGNTCISRSYTCHVGPGCACNG